MRLLDLTLPTPEENLALDEALLEEADAGAGPRETLRLWEPRQAMVVVGRSTDVSAEVRLDACRQAGVPVLRRPSGGSPIVAGPGCLMYGLVLSYEMRPAIASIDQAHALVLGRIAEGLGRLAPGVCRQGISDLALGDVKFSGNSVRCRRRHLLYHGTLLYAFPLQWIERCLAMPRRQPAYRRGRDHRDFVGNLPLPAELLRQSLVGTWNAEPSADWPARRTAQLVAEKYSRPQWNGQGNA